MAGPSFELPYDGGFHFNKYCEPSIQVRPPTYPPESTIFIKSAVDDKYSKANVIKKPSLHSIKLENGNIIQIKEKDMHKKDPTAEFRNSRFQRYHLGSVTKASAPFLWMQWINKNMVVHYSTMKMNDTSSLELR